MKTKKNIARSDKKNILLFIIFISLIFLIFIIASEIILRSMIEHTSFKRSDSLYKFIRPSEDTKLGFELAPNVSGYIYDAQVYINPKGERGINYPYKKDKDTTRVVFIGDSVTFGYGIWINESYPYVFEREYSKATGKKVEAVNLGVYSYNTVQQVEALKTKGLQYSPDIVVMGFYISNPEGVYNRLDTQRGPVSKMPQGIQRFLKNSALFKVTSKAAVLALNPGREKEPFKAIYNESTDTWKDFIGALDELERMSEENEFQVVFLIHPLLEDFRSNPLEEYHEIVKELAEERGFMTVDLIETYINYDPLSLRAAQEDHSHPNYLASKLISARLIEEMDNAKK